MTTRRDFFRLLPVLPAAALAIAKPEVTEPAPKVAEKEIPGVPAERVTSPVTDAIRAESGGNPRLAQYLSRRAAELRRENPKASAEDIAGMLQSWSSTEDDGNEAAA